MTPFGWAAVAVTLGIVIAGLSLRWLRQDGKRRLARERRRMRDGQPERQDNVVRIRR